MKEKSPVLVNSRIVAVIEDDPYMRSSIVRLLRAHEIRSEPYASAEAFLEGLATSQANCLVIDIHLGRMSGIDLHQHLIASGSSLPVIFMTSDGDDAIKDAAVDADCFAYLPKPLAAKLLIEAINNFPN